MAALQTLSALALKRLRQHVCVPAGAGPDSQGETQPNPLTDHEREITDALHQANERVWLALEAALAGDFLAEQMGHWQGGNLDEPLCRQVCSFLDAIPLAELCSYELRRQCWQELHAARTTGFLTRGSLNWGDLIRQASPPDTTAEDPLALERETLRQLADELQQAGYVNLCSLPALRSPGDQSFFVLGTLAFFRRAVCAAEPGLFHEWGWVEPETHNDAWEGGFAALADVLGQNQEWLEAILNDLSAHAVRPATASSTVPASAETDISGELQAGLMHLNRAAYDRAIACFSTVIRVDPQNAQAYAHRGEANRLRCEYVQAVADFSEAVRLDPDQAVFYIKRGLVYRLEGKHEQAIDDFTQALQLDPDNAVAYNNRGLAHAERCAYDQAIADYTAALERDPKYFWAYDNRGKAHSIKGYHRLAVADYTRVLALNPDHAPAYAARGDALRQSGEYTRAIADYTAALRLNPHDAAAQASRGDAYRLRGENQPAIADYTAALALEPHNADLYCRRGLTYRLEEAYDNALADLNKALERDPKNVAAYYNRGKVRSALEDDTLAIADYTEALWLQPEYAVAYVDRALAHTRQGQIQEALSDCTKALELNHQLAAAYYLREAAYASGGKEEEAIADLSKVIGLDPQFSLAYLECARIYTKRGEYDHALSDYSAALRLEPDNALALAQRGLTYQLKGQQQQALEDLGRAFRVDTAGQVLACWSQALGQVTRHVYTPTLGRYVEGLPRERAVAPAPAEPKEADTPRPTRKQAADRAAEGEDPAPRLPDPNKAAAATQPSPRAVQDPPQPIERSVSSQPAIKATTGKEETLAEGGRTHVERRSADALLSEFGLELLDEGTPGATPSAAASGSGQSPEQAAAATREERKGPEARPAKPNRAQAQEVVRPAPKERSPDKTQNRTQVTAKEPSAATAPQPVPQAQRQAAPATPRPSSPGPATPPPAKAAPDPVHPKPGPASKGDIASVIVHCCTCGHEFIPLKALEDGRVRCPHCQAAFVPRSPAPGKKTLIVKSHPKARAKVDINLAHWAPLGLALALLLGMGYLFLAPGRSQGDQQPLFVKAPALWHEYAEDPEGANQKYKGRPLVVSGTVAQVRHTSKDVCVVLESPSRKGWSIECYLPPGPEAEQVSQGQPIGMLGVCKSRKQPTAPLQLSSCKVVSDP